MQLRTASSFRQLIPSRFWASLRYRWLGLQKTDSFPDFFDAAAQKEHSTDGFKHLAFTFAVIALSARVAACNGRVSSAAYAAFREGFPLQGGICPKLRRLFTMACESGIPAEHYAQQIKLLFPEQAGLHRALLERLFAIATADGIVSPEEEKLLATIGHTLSISAADYTTIRDRYFAPKAHTVLGLKRKSSAAQIKQRYHTLMKDYHPDRFGGETTSPEVALMLQMKASEINAAYGLLRKRA